MHLLPTIMWLDKSLHVWHGEMNRRSFSTNSHSKGDIFLNLVSGSGGEERGY